MKLFGKKERNVIVKYEVRWLTVQGLQCVTFADDPESKAVQAALIVRLEHLSKAAEPTVFNIQVCKITREDL